MTPRPKVLISPRSLTATRHEALQQLESAGFELVFTTAGQQPDESELLRLVPGCVGWIAGVEPVSEAVIVAATELLAVSRNGVGIDNFPVRLLQDRGIRVHTADGANAAGVAELTIGLIFAALRHIPFTDAGIKGGGWPRRRGREIHGRTVGIIGCGAIGTGVAKLATGVGANVAAYDPVRRDLGISAESFRWADISEILADSDIVTLHCPPASDGRPLIGVDELDSMRDGAILVNAARASLVDELAVCNALDSDRLRVYATDVFPQEPPISLTLARHPNVIATSHIGALTEESIDRATASAVAKLLETIRPLGLTRASQI